MFCPKCGSKVNDNEKFCKYCGVGLASINENTNYNVAEENITEEDLIKAYVGNNYEKIVDSNFSFPTFFFSIYYMLYRKLWLYSLLWILFNCIISIIFNEYTKYLVIIFVNALVAVNFSKLYLQYVKMRVNKIQQNNKGMANNELIKICKRKGNTTIVPIIVIFILIIIVIIFLIVMLSMVEMFSNTDIPDNNIKSNLLQYDIPTGFSSISEYSSDYQKFRYMSATDYCTITIKMKKNYQNKSLDDYFKSSIYSSRDDQISNIETKQINGTSWNYILISNDRNTEHHLATIKNNDIYEIEYSIYQDDTKYCSNNYGKFINSLDFTNTNKDFNSI